MEIALKTHKVGKQRLLPNNISTVDYDLTEMSSDMVYATVYQMMMEPEKI